MPDHDQILVPPYPASESTELLPVPNTGSVSPIEDSLPSTTTASLKSRNSTIRNTEKTRRKHFLLSNPADPTTYDLPTGHIKKDGQQNITIREYRRNWQRTRILLISTTRVVFTAFLCALCAIVLKQYQTKQFLTIEDVQWLSTSMTVLPLLVGLNYRSSLHSYAKVLRWKILATWEWPLRQFDLILDAAESQALLKLGWYARRPLYAFIPNGVQLASALWLLVNVAGGIGIALLSLTYSLDSNGDSIAWRRGTATALNISNPALFDSGYYYGVYSSPSLTTSDTASAERKLYPGLIKINASLIDSQCDECQMWNYTLVLKHPTSGDTGPGTEGMSAVARCNVYPIWARNESVVTYRMELDAGNATRTVNLPWPGDLSNSTLYVYDRGRPDYDCKFVPGCVSILILKGSYSQGDRELLYRCTNRVLGFSTILSDHDTRPANSTLSKSGAQALAAAITQPRKLAGRVGTEFVQYKGVDAWSLNTTGENLSYDVLADVAANTLAQFSMTAVAAADQGTEYLPPHIATGDALRYKKGGTATDMQPYRPSRLRIKWYYAIAILCTVPALQLTVLFTIVIFANDAVVKDDSHLCVSRLLAPVVSRLGEQGSLLSVQEVVEELGDDAVRLRYGWEPDGENKRVRIFQHNKQSQVLLREAGSRVRRNLRRFPEGKYD